MPLTDTALDQMDTHAPFVIFLAFVIVLGVIITVLAIADGVRDRRDRRAADLAQRDAARERAAGIQEGFRRGWHG
jgi:hypothetical protein